MLTQAMLLLPFIEGSSGLPALAIAAVELPAWLSGLLAGYGPTTLKIFEIIWINIVLSGDNALVIALACRALPERQRAIGVALGALVAVVMRIVFTVAVHSLLMMPWLRVIGGVLLLWIAVKLLLDDAAGDDDVTASASLWKAVQIVALADIVMSLDNVLAIAAIAHGDVTLIVAGLIISIPLVVFGASVVTALLTRFPLLVWAGAGLLGWIAGDLIASDGAAAGIVASIGQVLALSAERVAELSAAAGAALVLAIGWIGSYAVRRSTTTA